MKVDIAVDWAGGVTALHRVLGISREAIYKWKNSDGLVPLARAVELEVASRGALKLDPSEYGITRESFKRGKRARQRQYTRNDDDPSDGFARGDQGASDAPGEPGAAGSGDQAMPAETSEGDVHPRPDSQPDRGSPIERERGDDALAAAWAAYQKRRQQS